MSSATRELLADRYRLTERVATGGMGVVWRASDERLGRDVAIKLIRPEYADDPTFRQRLDLEARATAAIRSPHVVRLHDVCEQQDPEGGYQSFIVMELVDGRPLSAVLRDGRLPNGLAIGVVQQTAAALAAAHDQQIIHRDIKPANLMLDSEGRVTVLDFGIARAADAVALTATDLVLGTPRYISPEQADGRGATAASDVYSLGIVAYQCLAGVVPFDASSDVAVALAHLREPVPALPPDVPPALARLVERMLAKAPSDRPTAQETAAALATMATAAESIPTEAVTASIPVVDRATKVLKTLPLPRREHIALHDLSDSRSATVQPITLVPLAVVAVIAFLIAATAAGLRSDPSLPRASSSGSSTPSHTVAALIGPTEKKVRLDATRYAGKPWTVVRAQLRALGLSPVPRFIGDGPVHTVINLAPTGKLDRGSTVAVLVSRLGPTPHDSGPGPDPHNPKPPPAHDEPHGGPGGDGPPGQGKKP